MKTEIGGTFKWSTDQIGAYADAFREGDAIYVEGEGWSEVRSYGGADAGNGSMLEVHRPLNEYAINHIEKSGYVLGYESGFDKRYKIITPKDYKVQEGDKLVWLGETQEYYGRSELTFGSVYDVRRDGDHLIYKTDDTLSILARSEKDRWKFWGVIPRYENVKEEEGKLAEQEAFEYLLTIDETAIKNFMTKEISDWAKEFTEQKDYSNAKRAIEILEKMEVTK